MNVAPRVVYAFWSLTILLAATLTGQERSTPVGAEAAARLLKQLDSIPWNQPYDEWSEGRTAPECRESRSDAYWGSADMQWCHRCRNDGKDRGTEYLFYVFDLDRPLCRLQQARLREDAPNPDVLREIRQSVEQNLASRFGPASIPEDVHEFGSAYWSDIRLWRLADRDLYLYATKDFGDRPPAVEILARSGGLRSALEQDDAINDIRFGRATREALDRRLVAELSPDFPGIRVLEKEVLYGEDETPHEKTIEALLRSAASAPDQRTALLLLAADRIAARLMAGPDPAEGEGQKTVLGLSFVWSPLGGAWHYQHDLLLRVWNKYPETYWGEQAFLLLQEMGWDARGMCHAGSDLFRLAISNGEEFLSQRPDSPARLSVIFSLARAYETWWSLSRAGRNDDYADPAEYQEGAEAARAQAVARYEEILRDAPTSGEALYARRQLPRLKLGVDTNQRAYFCVYD